MPSSSQCSEKIRLMSAERLLKKYAHVGVLGDAAARELRLEAIDDPTTVEWRSPRSSDAGWSTGELELPVGQHDGAEVLSNSVLRECSDDRRMADAQDGSDSPVDDGWTRGERPGNVLAIAPRISFDTPGYPRSFTMRNDMPFPT